MTSLGEHYLGEVEALLNGPRGERRRLVDELRAHLADAVAAGTPEVEAVRQLGSPGSVAAAWRTRCAREASRVRRRVGACVLGLAVASVLAVAGHAQGGSARPLHQQPCVGSTHGAATAASCQRQDAGR